MSESAQKIETPQKDCFACRAVSSGLFVLAGILFVAEARRTGSKWKPWQSRAIAYPLLGLGAYIWMKPSLDQIDEAQTKKAAPPATPSETPKNS